MLATLWIAGTPLGDAQRSIEIPERTLARLEMTQIAQLLVALEQRIGRARVADDRVVVERVDVGERVVDVDEVPVVTPHAREIARREPQARGERRHVEPLG